jgi:hypothetical protein
MKQRFKEIPNYQEVPPMSKCQIRGCTNDVGINPKTGRPNLLCRSHYLESLGPDGKSASSPARKKAGTNRPKREKKPAIPEVETFVLRGHTLTINYTGKTKHIDVNMFTRAVKFNDDLEGSSGKIFHYVIDIKQGSERISRVLFDTKAERDREFAKLQILLSRL